MIEEGDIVIYRPGDGRELLAVVEEVIVTGAWGFPVKLKVSFLTPNVHPQTMEVNAYACEKFDAGTSSGKPVVCECGADKVYGKNKDSIFHAVWCPLVPRGSYGKNN